MELNPDQLNELLPEALPELRDAYEREVADQEGENFGSHVMYGNVLEPHLVRCLVEGRLNDAQRVLQFVESLLRLDDEYAREVVEQSVFEGLQGRFAEGSEQERLLGPLSREIVERLRREIPG